jgi:integrase/recombinase XerD
MSEKPISPMRQRMLEDMNLRRFVPDTQREYIRAVKRACDLSRPFPRHRDPGRAARVPAASDQERCATTEHQRDRDCTAVLLQGDARPAGDDAPSRVRLRTAQAATRGLARRGVAAAGGRPGPKHKGALSVAYGAGLRAMEASH